MAAGAGGHEVERIAVKVVPDTGGFKEKLKAFLEQVEAGNKVEVDVELKGETTAKAKLETLSENLTATIKVKLEGLAQARIQLARLIRNQTIHIDVEVDDRLANLSIGRSFRNRKFKINADLDLTNARARLNYFLRPRRIKIYADIDRRGFMEMAQGLGYIFRLMNGVSRQISQASEVSQSAFQQMSRSASGFGNIVRPIYLIALPFLIAAIYLLIGAVAGLVIIVGAAVAGLLLMLPPIAALGAGIAYILKSSDKQAKKLKKQFKDVGKTAQDVLRSAIKPMTKAIQEEIPHIKRWVRTLEGPLRSAFKGASKHIGTLSLGIQQFVDNTLAGLVAALNNPQMTDAMEGFRSFLAQLGTALGTFFQTLAEGGTDYGKMFESLGAALVQIAPSMAEMLNAFAKVSPDVIESLADNLTQLFETLSDPKVLESLTILSKFSFDAIVFGLQMIAAQIIYTVTLWTWMWESAKWIFNTVKQILTDFYNHLKQTWDKAVNYAQQKAQEWYDKSTSPFRSFVVGVKSLLDWLSENFVSFWSRLISRSSSGANNTKTAAVGPFSGMASAISGIMSTIVGIVEAAWDRISGIVSRIAGAVSRARGMVSGLSGLADKVNPFNLFSAPPDDGSNTAPMTTFSAPSEPTFTTFGGLDSIANSVDQMSHVDRNLRRKFQRSFDPEEQRTSLRATGSPAPTVYNVEVNAAPTVPTEKTIVRALKYADALYAPA